MVMERQLDLEHRITTVEDRAKSNTRRLDRLEKVTDAIHEMSTTMVQLVEQTKHTNENVAIINDKVENLNSKVECIEREPAEKLKHLKDKVITAIVTGVVGAILGALLSLIIK